MLTMTTKSLLFFCVVYAFFHELMSHNILRPADSSLPSIRVTSTLPKYTQLWNTKTKKTTNRKNEAQKDEILSSKFLQLASLQDCFCKEDLATYALPHSAISFRTDTRKTVLGTTLSNLAEHAVDELRNGKKKFLHFTILKDSDFNYDIKAGLIVLKYKTYPFVLKLSIEHPHTFVQPFDKGFVPSAIFSLSGTNRHMSGLTRIANLHTIKKLLQDDARFDFIRKWFWLPTPQQQPWLIITWQDPLSSVTDTITLPSIYGVIADFIQEDKVYAKKHVSELKQLSIDTANKLGFKTDPHSGNFVPEYNPHNSEQTPKIIIIDTEDFPLTVGLNKEKPMQAKNYADYYFQLCKNYIKKRLGRSKQQRIKEQRKTANAKQIQSKAQVTV